MKKEITLLGAGLVGSLMSIYLAKKGYSVSIYEKRDDMRKGNQQGGRSINLALSNRGLKALEEVGLAEQIKRLVIPMKGRMMHDVKGNLTYQPYGKEGQFINSVSRSWLNEMLMDEAEKLGVNIHFEHRCSQVNLDTQALEFETPSGSKRIQSEVLLGADGAFSALRDAMQRSDRFNYSQYYIEHGYKELCIEPQQGEFAMEPNALHIWPRGRFMMIALPNTNETFTCTLFLDYEGEDSFANLQTPEQVEAFFKTYFPDVIPLIPDLTHQFFQNPTPSLVTVKCYPWVKNRTCLMGDAAHAIVPFYGQGMNAGFEDCRVLNELIDTHQHNWDTILPEFQQARKPNADAIAELALKNFVEMRDLVADSQFLLQKKIEAHLHEQFPKDWIPLYSMVTFSDLSYADALRIGQKQHEIMQKVMSKPDIEKNWPNLDFASIVEQLKA
ncbi:NAD(P)/FAD-dependent oxidoreductase [Cytophagales bacterium LB-30]|uniref:Kynurenine 3-monooxygenase n=1 Tax=Shiella aurantiaca TaxID=3058365 RepID=A0ABT8F5R5_9BACT|nr:NAD(P)/FAD-dependent oxidoreductase [Shiella aurantiaca]MDN4165614.1 NAD(P)/FAD-dependent oxidoreductase [Shiella aurantiaca]